MKTPALDGIAYQIAPFDFERDGDRASTVPRPDWVIPDHLSLPTDDPDWMPDIYRKA
jgi:hypothetical protein